MRTVPEKDFAGTQHRPLEEVPKTAGKGTPAS
jgi:hypothetical protein